MANLARLGEMLRIAEEHEDTINMDTWTDPSPLYDERPNLVLADTVQEDFCGTAGCLCGTYSIYCKETPVLPHEWEIQSEGNLMTKMQRHLEITEPEFQYLFVNHHNRDKPSHHYRQPTKLVKNPHNGDFAVHIRPAPSAAIRLSPADAINRLKKFIQYKKRNTELQEQWSWWNSLPKRIKAATGEPVSPRTSEVPV